MRAHLSHLSSILQHNLPHAHVPRSVELGATARNSYPGMGSEVRRSAPQVCDSCLFSSDVCLVHRAEVHGEPWRGMGGSNMAKMRKPGPGIVRGRDEGRGQACPGAFRVSRWRAAQGVSCRDVREVHARLPEGVRFEAVRVVGSLDYREERLRWTLLGLDGDG
ncbi:hypothetical protein CMUS01_05772 [Colletotrichum musicola]|uniref:Uncharacterized protein n=1 Tax=Colletotrichum musicola TaxID=2175873 RepID=A0A8H6NJR9_9PEZI|nr:hypothetical protein CMUS01_05772 [Colletotrichum musicola]